MALYSMLLLRNPGLARHVLLQFGEFLPDGNAHVSASWLVQSRVCSALSLPGSALGTMKLGIQFPLFSTHFSPHFVKS